MKIHQGDALAVLRTMPAESAQTCVTSPPYWGLRDYGTAKWKGGAKNCDHRKADIRTLQNLAQAANACDGGTRTAAARKDQNLGIPYADTCAKCGARRVDLQIGLEATPEAFIARMVEVFREVRRVLKADGTLWLNLGDSYATGPGKVGECPGGGAQGAKYRGDHGRDPKSRGIGPQTQPNRLPIAGLKPKDLIGIPWRVALALQADGWYLRSDIIWHKPNPMPESVRDRPTKSHEYIFLLSKGPRYYYDADAIKEPTTGTAHSRGSGVGLVETRNKRTVWTVAPRPYKGAHFATFPPSLIEPCILAGAPIGGVVLDPFSGAGTTAITAERLGRRGVGIELNPEYIELTAARRVA